MGLRLKQGVEVWPFGKQCEALTADNTTPEQVQYLLDTNKITEEDLEESEPVKTKKK